MNEIPTEEFFRLTAMYKAVYDRYGIADPPTKETDWPSSQKIEFFIDMLKTNDASDPENLNVSDGGKTLLN